MFELAEAFDTGISHPRWAGRPCVSVCLHMERDEKHLKIKSLCVTRAAVPLCHANQWAFYIPEGYATKRPQ